MSERMKDRTGEREKGEMDKSRFAPFLDEIIIDANDLPIPHDQALAPSGGGQSRQPPSAGSTENSRHILQEMAIVKSRIGFDEQSFRSQCQRVQAEMCQEFKSIVDEIYDVLEAAISEYNKGMYQLQVDTLKEFEGKLSEIRRLSIHAATMEQSMQNFINQISQAYRAAFEE